MSNAIVSNSLPPLTLRMEKGPHAKEVFLPTKAALNIGRGIENEIVLSNDPKVSRQHIKISYLRGQYVVENISGKNAVFVDGKQVEIATLKKGSVITIGDSEIVVEYDEPKQPTAKPAVNALKETPLHLIKNQNSPQLKPQATVANKMNRPPGPAMPPPPKYGSAPNNMRQAYAIPPKAPEKNPMFLVMIIIIGLGLFFFFSNEDKKANKAKLKLKSKEAVEAELKKSQEVTAEYMKKVRIGPEGEMDSVTQSAQAYFVKGFRDYRQGQYGRAIQALQACLSFDPNHALAKKYLNSAIRKIDEQVQILLVQGKRYLGSGNFRLCKASFQQVMILRRDPNDATYKEAKQYFDQCDYQTRGRF